jgi:hypothetical protein
MMAAIMAAIAVLQMLSPLFPPLAEGLTLIITKLKTGGAISEAELAKIDKTLTDLHALAQAEVAKRLGAGQVGG